MFYWSLDKACCSVHFCKLFFPFLSFWKTNSHGIPTSRPGLSINDLYLWEFLSEGLDLVRRPLYLARLCLFVGWFFAYSSRLKYKTHDRQKIKDGSYLLPQTNTIERADFQITGLNHLSQFLPAIFTLCLRNLGEKTGDTRAGSNEDGCTQSDNWCQSICLLLGIFILNSWLCLLLWWQIGHD